MRRQSALCVWISWNLVSIVLILGRLATAQEATAPFKPEPGEPASGPPTATLSMRVRVGADTPRPCAIHIFGRYSKRNEGSFFPPHSNITRRGLFKGSNTGIRPETMLLPGGESPWIDLDSLLAPVGRTHLFLDAVESYREYLPACSFAVDISTNASDSGIISRFNRTGTGAGLRLTFEPEPDAPILCNEHQAPALADFAASLPPVRGRRAKRFPLLTGATLDARRDSHRVLDANLSILSHMGLNGLFSPGVDAGELVKHGFTCFGQQGYLQSAWCRERCWMEPDLNMFKQQMAVRAQRARTAAKQLTPILWMLGDEYSSRRLERIRDESLYHPHFRMFLKKLGLTPDAVGAASWDAVLPAAVDERNTDPARYYYSCLFRGEVLATHMRNGSRVVSELLPGVPTAMNFPESATYHANLQHSGDWFCVMEQGDLGFGWTETWLPYNETMQVTTYHYALMRAACRKRGQPYGFYIIMRGPYPWDNAAKAASAIGHGANALHFYNYGPRHNGTQDAWSHKTNLYARTRAFTHQVGAVEDLVIQGRPVPATAAIVYSRTSDIWNLHLRGNPFGTERISLHLLLQHIGIPTEFLTENDILAGLSETTRLLFLVDSHLQEGIGEEILKWVRRGGVLYCSAGSAMFDHLNRPRDFLESAGIRRGEFETLKGFPLRPMLQFHGLGSHGAVNWKDHELDIIWAKQPLLSASGSRPILKDNAGAPLAAVLPLGKGRIVYAGFWPGVSYRHGAVLVSREENDGIFASGEANTTTAYSPAFRDFLLAALDPLPLTQDVLVDDPFVEARTLQGPAGRLVVLANWSGRNAEVGVRIKSRNAGPAPRVIGRPDVTFQREGEAWTTRLVLGPSTFISSP